MASIETLIERWQKGDERAAEAIYASSRGTTFALACALLDNPSDAEEVTQDVLVYALSHINQYDPQRARFSTWLHTITVSRCRNRRRRRWLPEHISVSRRGGMTTTKLILRPIYPHSPSKKICATRCGLPFAA